LGCLPYFSKPSFLIFPFFFILFFLGCDLPLSSPNEGRRQPRPTRRAGLTPPFFSFLNFIYFFFFSLHRSSPFSAHFSCRKRFVDPQAKVFKTCFSSPSPILAVLYFPSFSMCNVFSFFFLIYFPSLGQTHPFRKTTPFFPSPRPRFLLCFIFQPPCEHD